MSVIINPGAGPVGGATRENAEACMRQFITDLELPGVTYEYIGGAEKPEDGRFEFNLNRGRQNCGVAMPGLPVEDVRYIDRQKQNSLAFPRMYVEGNSWVWLYGLSQAHGYLTENES
jgi:hypothetical protein